MKDTRHQDWLGQLRTGDRSALRAIFDQQYEPVCKAIFRFVQDPGLTEDLAQEVFVRFWEKREQIQVDSNLSAYLRRMAVNEALAYLRKKTRFRADELPILLPISNWLRRNFLYGLPQRSTPCLPVAGRFFN